jgi:type IV secretion system protein VirD4
MTPAQNAAPPPNLYKLIVVGLLGILAASYLGAYFFLLFLKLKPTSASPFTLPRYAYYYWDNPPVRARLIGASLVGVLMASALALLLFLPKRRSLHGDARWAKARDIRQAGLFSDHGILLGRYGRRYLVLPGQTGAILAAPPRSGKGVSCVIPNLLNWPGSVLVLDIKKENWVRTAGHRSCFSEVYLFDPFSADGRTSRWNPFTYVSDNPYLRIDDVQRIATMLCQEAPGSDPFWVKSARSLFVGIALYLFERRDYERAYNHDPATTEPIPEVPVTVGEVLRQAMASDEEGFSKHWKRIIDGWAALGKPLSPQCVSLIMDVVDLATQTASSVRKTFTSQLDLWLNPLLDMATAASDFDLRDLRRKKISVYLGIKPRDFERLQVVMNVFFQQAIGEQTAELPELNPELQHQLLVVLDEFTAVGKIPILLNSIAFVPGYNVRTLMVIQTPSQLDEVYGQNGRKIMLKTLAARIIFPPNDMEDARNVSEELGYTTVKSRSRTVPGVLGGGKRSPSTNVSDHRRALMLPQEIKEMPADRQLLFVEHVLPVKCHKIRYFEDPVFKERLLPPPGVPKQDISKYSGGRTDDHFPLWQERIHPATPVAAATPVRPPAIATAPATATATKIRTAAPVPAAEFDLDFSDVTIPPGRFLTSSEMDAAVNSFCDEIETE